MASRFDRYLRTLKREARLYGIDPLFVRTKTVENCTDGFGGAITAALFVEKFVKDKPWAQLDIYAWNDKAKSGNGQPVQTLIQFLMEQ